MGWLVSEFAGGSAGAHLEPFPALRTIAEVYFSADTPGQAGKALPVARAGGEQCRVWAVQALLPPAFPPSTGFSCLCHFLPLAQPGEGAGLSLRLGIASNPKSL